MEVKNKHFVNANIVIHNLFKLSTFCSTDSGERSYVNLKKSFFLIRGWSCMSDDRLDRIEGKVDKLADAIIQMAHMEERLVSVFRINRRQ